MRVTNNMFSGNIVTNINETAEKMFRINNMLSSGKRIKRPSDNPVDAAKSLSLRAGIRQVEQYKRNLDSSQVWLDETEVMMSESISILQQIRDLTLQSANDTNGADDKNTIRKRIDMLHEQLKSAANHSLSGRFIFAGSKTQDVPFDPATWTYFGNTERLNREISPSSTMSVNLSGEEVFALDSTQNYGIVIAFPDGNTSINSIFALLEDLSSKLAGALDPRSLGFYVEGIDMALENFFNKLGDVGAKSARIEMLLDQHENSSINLTKYLSKNEDVDFAKAVTDLKLHETVYEATLAASARMMQVTLLDFLR